MEVLGGQTRSIFLNEAESHKLHLEFEVAVGNSVLPGVPVKLNATGKIVPAAATEPYNNIIGVSIHKAGAGELATVAMKGYAVVWARANADSQDAGPVAWKGMSIVTNETAFGKYGALEADTPAGSATGVPIVPAVNCLAGWALDAGDEDDVIRVCIAG